MRKLESIVGRRYLTQEPEDPRWLAYMKQHNLDDWETMGNKPPSKEEIINFNKARQGDMG